MYARLFCAICILASAVLSCASVSAAQRPDTTIVCSAAPSHLERLAAKEIRRYVYVRTGELLPIAETSPRAGNVILVGRGIEGLAEEELFDLLQGHQVEVPGYRMFQTGSGRGEFDGPLRFVSREETVDNACGERVGARSQYNGKLKVTLFPFVEVTSTICPRALVPSSRPQ